MNIISLFRGNMSVFGIFGACLSCVLSVCRTVTCSHALALQSCTALMDNNPILSPTALSLLGQSEVFKWETSSAGPPYLFVWIFLSHVVILNLYIGEYAGTCFVRLTVMAFQSKVLIVSILMFINVGSHLDAESASTGRECVGHARSRSVSFAHKVCRWL